MYNTFNGWKRLGRVVAIGERGLFRNEYGDMMYSVYQTVSRGAPLGFGSTRRPLGFFYPTY